MKITHMARRLAEAERRADAEEKKFKMVMAALEDIADGKQKHSAQRLARAVVNVMKEFGEPMEFVVSEIDPTTKD